MTGRGDWELKKKAAGAYVVGRYIRLSVRASDVLPRPKESRLPYVFRRESGVEEWPQRYEWEIGVREMSGELQLYFLTGDPDVRNYYILKRR